MVSSGLPTTSDTIRVATGAGAAASASRPPFSPERWRRTVFTAVIGSPLRSRAAPTACRSARVHPGSGTSARDDPPPDSSTRTRSSRPADRATSRRSCPARNDPGPGTGCSPTTDCSPGTVAGSGDTITPVTGSPSSADTAPRAMAVAALPRARTITLPLGAAKSVPPMWSNPGLIATFRWTAASGSAASTAAASTSTTSRRALGSVSKIRGSNRGITDPLWATRVGLGPFDPIRHRGFRRLRESSTFEAGGPQ